MLFGSCSISFSTALTASFVLPRSASTLARTLTSIGSPLDSPTALRASRSALLYCRAASHVSITCTM